MGIQEESEIDISTSATLIIKRVVFNIRGNDFRLIVDIEYKLRMVFVIWFGTHGEYELDVNTIGYEN